MDYKTAYWDDDAQQMFIRDCTPEEIAEIEARAVQAAKDLAEEVKQAKSDYIASVRKLREALLNRIAGITIAAQLSADTDLVSACQAARLRLLNITTVPTVLAATTVEELTAAVKAEYASIVRSVPVGLMNAFDKVDT